MIALLHCVMTIFSHHSLLPLDCSGFINLLIQLHITRTVIFWPFDGSVTVGSLFISGMIVFVLV